VTNDLVRRVYEHKKKYIKSFTEKYNVRILLYYEIYNDIENAIKREKILKGWKREKKEELINNVNPYWSDKWKEIIN
jgi:putative endonuclease